ncbi:MAG: hypothetical protein R2845_13585 [Thermomicrobiales bacterium]
MTRRRYWMTPVESTCGKYQRPARETAKPTVPRSSVNWPVTAARTMNGKRNASANARSADETMATGALSSMPRRSME